VPVSAHRIVLVVAFFCFPPLKAEKAAAVLAAPQQPERATALLNVLMARFLIWWASSRTMRPNPLPPPAELTVVVRALLLPFPLPSSSSP